MEGEKKMMLVRKYGRVVMLSPVIFSFFFGELSIMKKKDQGRDASRNLGIPRVFRLAS